MGSGWAWDDYNSAYSPEISAMPIYGNLAYFNRDTVTRELLVAPGFLVDSVTIKEGDSFDVRRQEWSNRFEVRLGECNDCERYRPLRMNDEMLVQLFSDTLNIPVSLDTLALPDEAELIYSMPKDSVLKVMMQDSDNFLAEQLLLQAGMMLTDTLNSRFAIDTIQTYLDTFLPDTLAWVDGSGLSRYNMVTPRSIVRLWQELIKIYGQQRLLNLLAVGGEVGTIEQWYTMVPPYIYGKTGTLRHNHVLSGLLMTKSGKTLIFSYMHNHYNSGSTPIKEEMEQVLYEVYEKY
jgi:D-alanyl-D-alanine carboxypeptidase/D-alanyl-D-alanine-endopeptidase (penicillin-binding protein 4)